MANAYRGEIDASLDGASYTLCLTLGALAELETAFGSDDMLSLANRFGAGRISALDCVRIIGAGLRGGGHDIEDAAVGRMRGLDGAAGYVDIVARLLAATFGGPAVGPVVVTPAASIAHSVLDALNSEPGMAKAQEPETAVRQAFPAEPPRPFPGPR